jgi:hypothetical protein
LKIDEKMESFFETGLCCTRVDHDSLFLPPASLGIMEELWDYSSPFLALDAERPVSYIVDLLTKTKRRTIPSVEVCMADLVALHKMGVSFMDLVANGHAKIESLVFYNVKLDGVPVDLQSVAYWESFFNQIPKFVGSLKFGWGDMGDLFGDLSDEANPLVPAVINSIAEHGHLFGLDLSLDKFKAYELSQLLAAIKKNTSMARLKVLELQNVFSDEVLEEFVDFFHTFPMLSLSLSHSLCEAAQMSRIIQSICLNRALISLTLRSYPFKNKGVELYWLLKDSKSLEVVEISDCDLLCVDFVNIFKALDINSSVLKLHLSFLSLSSVESDCWAELGETFRNVKLVQSLCLGFSNELSQTFAYSMETFISGLSFIESLKELNLLNPPTSLSNYNSLMISLKTVENLRVIGFYNCELPDEVELLGEALSSLKHLQSLQISRSKLYSDKLAVVLNSLISNDFLESLDFNSNDIGFRAGNMLASFISESSASLTQLDLHQNGLRQGTLDIAHAIGQRKNGTLTHLDISENKIPHYLLDHLCGALKKSTSLVFVRLQDSETMHADIDIFGLQQQILSNQDVLRETHFLILFETFRKFSHLWFEKSILSEIVKMGFVMGHNFSELFITPFNHDKILLKCGCESSFLTASGTLFSDQWNNILSSDFKGDLEQVQVALRIAEPQSLINSTTVSNAIMATFWFHLNFHCLEVNNWIISLLLNGDLGVMDPVNSFLCQYYSFNSMLFLQPLPTDYDSEKPDKQAWLKSEYLNYAIDHKERMEELLQASQERETNVFIIDPNLSDISHSRYVMDYLTGVVVVNPNDFQTIEECEHRCSQIIKFFRHQIMCTIAMPTHMDSLRRLVHLIKFHGLIARLDIVFADANKIDSKDLRPNGFPLENLNQEMLEECINFTRSRLSDLGVNLPTLPSSLKRAALHFEDGKVTTTITSLTRDKRVHVSTLNHDLTFSESKV